MNANEFVDNSNAFIQGVGAATVAVTPLAALSFPPLSERSTLDHTNWLRAVDLPGLPNFFDHSGNFINGILAADAITLIGTVVAGTKVCEEHRGRAITITALTAALGSSAVNTAYEAGVHMPPYPAKSPDAPFDGQDALYGSFAGSLFALVFCVAAFRSRRRTRNAHPDMTSRLLNAPNSSEY